MKLCIPFYLFIDIRKQYELEKENDVSDIKTFILISSLMTWSNTPELFTVKIFFFFSSLTNIT